MIVKKKAMFHLFYEQKHLFFYIFLNSSHYKSPPRGGRAACGVGGYAF